MFCLVFRPAKWHLVEIKRQPAIFAGCFIFSINFAVHLRIHLSKSYHSSTRQNYHLDGVHCEVVCNDYERLGETLIRGDDVARALLADEPELAQSVERDAVAVLELRVDIVELDRFYHAVVNEVYVLRFYALLCYLVA